MKFWVKTVDEAINLFNSPSLYKENDNIESKLTKEEEEFIKIKHKEILKKYKIECFCWKPDQEGYIRYNIKDTPLGLVKLFKNQINTFDLSK